MQPKLNFNNNGSGTFTSAVIGNCKFTESIGTPVSNADFEARTAPAKFKVFDNLGLSVKAAATPGGEPELEILIGDGGVAPPQKIQLTELAGQLVSTKFNIGIDLAKSIDIPIKPGHVHLNILGGALALKFSAAGNDPIVTLATKNPQTPDTLAVGANAKLVLSLNLFVKDDSDNSNKKLIGLPVGKIESGVKNFFSSELRFAQAHPIPSVTEPMLEIVSWNPANKEKEIKVFEAADAWQADPATKSTLGKFDIFDKVPLLGDLKDFVFGKVHLKTIEPRITSDKIILPIDGHIDIPGDEPLNFKDGHIEISSKSFVIGGQLPLFTFRIVQDRLWKTGPLALQVHKNSNLALSLDPRDPWLAFATAPESSGNRSSAMVVYVPGIKKEDCTEQDGKLIPKQGVLKKRFVFDVESDGLRDAKNKRRCRILPGGVQLAALARPTTINLGEGEKALIRNVKLDHGIFKVDQKHYHLDIAANGQLGYFKKSSGRLSVIANSGANSVAAQNPAPNVPRFLARFDAKLDDNWEDPSGLIEFQKPGASVQVVLKDDDWEVDGFVSGTLRLKPNPKFKGDAEEWLGDVFKKLSLKFENASLRDLVGGGGVKLNYQSDGEKSIKLWEVFEFELTEFSLGKNYFDFAANIHLQFSSGFYLMGNVPAMRTKLESGVQIAPVPGVPLRIAGKLKTPSGIKANVELFKEESAAHQRLAGRGALAIPSLPEIQVALGLEKRLARSPDGKHEKRIASFFFFAQMDYPVTLFPAIVLRNMGIGLGINQELRELGKNLRELGPKRLLKDLEKDPRGLPDPANPADWTGDLGDERLYKKTNVLLAARTFVCPSPAGDGPFPYVGDALLTLVPTDDFMITFSSNLWLFTGLDDAQTPAFRQRPVMQALMALYPRHGYIEAFAQTRKNPKMSAAPDQLSKAFSLVQSEMYLKATPNMFRMRVGPTRAEIKKGGFLFKGSLIYGIEASNSMAVMLMALDLFGSFDWNKQMRKKFGPLRIEAGMSFQASLGISVMCAGGFLGRDMGVAFYGEVRVHLSIKLKVYAKLKFRLKKKILFVKINISWEKKLSLSFELSFDAEVKTLLSTKGIAMKGSGRLKFRVFGHNFDPEVKFEIGETDKLERARARLGRLLPNRTSYITSNS